MLYNYIEGKIPQPALASAQQLRPDQPAMLEGWIYHIRRMGKFSFLLLRLRRETVQCVLSDERDVPLPNEGDWVTEIGRASCRERV